MRCLRAGLMIILLIGFSIFVSKAVFGEGGLRALLSLRHDRNDLQQQIDLLNQENRRLENEIKALRTDPIAIEHLAREQMRMARPGEIIFAWPQKKANETDDFGLPKPKTPGEGDP